MSLFWSVAAMLGNSAVVVVRTRPRAKPLAKITMRKSTHGFPLSFPCMMSMGLRLAALRAAGAPQKNVKMSYCLSYLMTSQKRSIEIF